MKKIIDVEFEEMKKFFQKKYKNIKSIHRNISKKGIFTTVILNDSRKGLIRLMDGEVDDIEKGILWAYVKALNSSSGGYSINFTKMDNNIAILTNSGNTFMSRC